MKIPIFKIGASEDKYKDNERHIAVEIITPKKKSSDISEDRHIIFICDTSGSTSNDIPKSKECKDSTDTKSILDTYKYSIKQFLKSFKLYNLHITIIEFNSIIKILCDGILNEETHGYYENKVENLKSSGGTNICSTLKYVVENLINRNDNNKTTLILATDGEATRGIVEPEHIISAMNNKIHMDPITVCFGNDVIGSKHKFELSNQIYNMDNIYLHWIDLLFEKNNKTERKKYADVFCNEIFIGKGNYHATNDNVEMLDTFTEIFRQCGVTIYKDVKLKIELITSGEWRRDHGKMQDYEYIDENNKKIIEYNIDYMNEDQVYEFIPILVNDYIDNDIYVNVNFQFTIGNKKEITKLDNYKLEYLDTETNLHKQINTCILFGNTNTLLNSQITNLNPQLFNANLKMLLISDLRKIINQSLNINYNNILLNAISDIEHTKDDYLSFCKIKEYKKYMSINTEIDRTRLMYHLNKCNISDTIRDEMKRKIMELKELEKNLTKEDDISHNMIINHCKFMCSFCNNPFNIHNKRIYHRCKGNSKRLDDIVSLKLYHIMDKIGIKYESKTIKSINYLKLIKFITTNRKNNKDFYNNVFKTHGQIGKKTLILLLNDNISHTHLEMINKL